MSIPTLNTLKRDILKTQQTIELINYRELTSNIEEHSHEAMLLKYRKLDLNVNLNNLQNLYKVLQQKADEFNKEGA
jgi:hypothetical protein